MDDTIFQMEFFKSKILEIINNSGLSIGIVYYILKDIFTETQKTYYTFLNAQTIQPEESQEDATSSQD